jgi:hypothetical protein
VILRTIWEAIVILLKAALAIVFIIFVVKKLVKINNFPRIGLPMLSYPECNTCDCDCGNAPQDDDFDSNSVTQDIQNQQNELSGGNQPPTAQSNSFLAPLNLPQTYTTVHPNFEQRAGFDANDSSGGYFLFCNNLFGIPLQYKSLTNRLVAQDIEAEVATQAILDFKRLFSGYDVLSGTDFNRFKAPQPFLFAAEKVTDFPVPIPDQRFFGRPRTVTYPQRLNEFNTRDKFFSGVNKIQTVVNPSLPGAQPFEDQIIVMIAQVGTTDTIGTGNLFSFQDPNQSGGQINLTGATLNQFGNNAITGTSLTDPIAVIGQVEYAITQNTNSAPIPITIIQSGSSENYLRYPTDMEYYQVITGMTVSTFEGLADFTTLGYFPESYLYHNIGYDIITPPDCTTGLPPIPVQIPNPPQTLGPDGVQVNNFTALKQVSQYENYEIIFVVRGVDPHTEKQTISYDLSIIFGETTFGNGPIIEGSYYLNQPIQGYPGGNKPKSHNTIDNTTTNLYFPSFTFTPDPTIYTPFISNLPYYFVSTDETPTYQPVGTHPTTSFLSPGMVQVAGTNTNKLPKYNNTPIDFGGGTFIAFQNNLYPLAPALTPNQSFFVGYTTTSSSQDQKMEYGWPGSPPNQSVTQVYALYSSTYYNLGLTGVDFNDSNNIVMRSDRLPTSTRTEGGPNGSTGYGLHQNNNFAYYLVGGVSDGGPTTSIGGNLPSGEGADNENQSLINTLTCENLVPLECYQGTGTNVTINPNCAIPADRVVRGCYCLLNKTYLFQYDEDVRLFLEWKTRFTITFAACRGVFAQVFQNNWINGVLYMFNFNKTTVYSGLLDTTPDYNYCKDTIIFNDLENNFYYRSSPWDGTNFIGKDAPPPQSFWPQSLITGYPGLGYNTKQIQFPTTIMDMGPREGFIAEICNNSNFNGYLVDQIKSTSYQDNSDLIQIGFLSRLLNDRFRQAILPIANPNGNNTEGKGIIQFFNSQREADRIDGDFAQMLSINSEWRINAFLAENYQNPASIFFGEDSQTGDGYPRPVFGVFFETDDIDYTYRRKLTPGNEYYSITPPLYYQYGYPKTQNVPHYRWKLEILSNNYIFGNENNNWDTNVTPSGGFFTKGYQNLDFNSDPYFQSSFNGAVQEGYITNLSGPNTPDPNYNVGTTPPGSSILVGAPYHFYFGLNNGKTAIDKFVKLYINNPDA